jgi:Cof subfamily protein (haloacid dehalogenase superfamily)
MFWGESMEKVIFFDIDGTLIHHDDEGKKQIPSTVITELKRLRDAGYLLFLASGRPFAFIDAAVSGFTFDGYILSNGAHVENHDTFLYHHPIERTKVEDLLVRLKEYGCEYILETKRGTYLDPNYTKLHEFFTANVNINEEALISQFDENQLAGDVLKLEVSAKGKAREDLEAYLKGRFNYDCHGTENAFEIYGTEVTKAIGVKKVLEHYQIDTKNSYAFGDGLNDLEMFQEVGNAIAMGNAVPELKAVATSVCGLVSENGLALALQELK